MKFVICISPFQTISHNKWSPTLTSQLIVRWVALRLRIGRRRNRNETQRATVSKWFIFMVKFYVLLLEVFVCIYCFRIEEPRSVCWSELGNLTPNTWFFVIFLFVLQLDWFFFSHNTVTTCLRRRSSPTSIRTSHTNRQSQSIRRSIMLNRRSAQRQSIQVLFCLCSRLNCELWIVKLNDNLMLIFSNAGIVCFWRWLWSENRKLSLFWNRLFIYVSHFLDWWRCTIIGIVCN